MNILLLIMLTASAVEPKAHITGPESARVGDLVRLSAADSEGSSLTYEWVVLPAGTQGFETVEFGKRAFFANVEPGRYTFVLAVGDPGGSLDIAIHELVVVGKSPQPASALAARAPRPDVRSFAAEHRIDARGARILAGTFRQVAGMIETGAITSKQQVVATTAKLAESALGHGFGAWEPFFRALAPFLDELEAHGYLGSVQRYRDVWNQLSDGLEQGEAI